MIDAVQVMYNIFDQAAAAELFPLCQQHDVGVIARSPLYYGALASPGPERGFPPDDWRRDYFFDEHRRETAARVAQLAGEVEAPDRSVADLALRFSLSHAAVSTVAVGMHAREQVDANMRALGHGALDATKRSALAGHRWLC
jgi:aryl-alcohol dehydrogenase-like predicted oxidoreductase